MLVKVLTFNIWGLWLVSKNRQERVRLIGEHLEKADLDVVLLQEVFVRSDVQTLITLAARGSLQHAQYFDSGYLGGELLILSRYPITYTRYHKYTVSGSPISVWEGDFYAAKGVAMACLATPCGPLHVYNTHTNANYNHVFQHVDIEGGVELPSDSNFPVRLVQFLELAYFIAAQSSQGDAPVVLGGDLNCGPQDIEVVVLRSLLPQLKDSWNIVHPDEPGCTSNYDLPGHVRKDPPKRIDFLLSSLMPVSAELVMDTTAAGMRLSDHLGLKTVFACNAAPSRKRFAVEPGLVSLIALHKALFKLTEEKLSRGSKHWVSIARNCAVLALAACAPVLIASLAIGIWLAATEKSIAGEIVMYVAAVLAALLLPLLLAFSVAFQGQASAMRVHASGL
ncbi:g5610 [Coccomyxa elongata]